MADVAQALLKGSRSCFTLRRVKLNPGSVQGGNPCGQKLLKKYRWFVAGCFDKRQVQPQSSLIRAKCSGKRCIRIKLQPFSRCDWQTAQLLLNHLMEAAAIAVRDEPKG